MSRRNTLENKRLRRAERESKKALQKKNVLQSKMLELLPEEDLDYKPCLPVTCPPGRLEE